METSQTVVQDILSLTRSVTGKAEGAWSPVKAAAWVLPQERPSWTVGMSSFSHRPALLPFVPLLAHRLALVPPLGMSYSVTATPKATLHGVLEEIRTFLFASGLVCFPMGPRPVVLRAAGLALALLAAGLCPCQGGASEPWDSGRVGVLAS